MADPLLHISWGKAYSLYTFLDSKSPLPPGEYTLRLKGILIPSGGTTYSTIIERRVKVLQKSQCIIDP
jgi:hypothetical protein